MSTILDVAREAEVSAATVSRVLNNDAKVSQDKKLRVLSAIQKLNYQPNLLGRSLRRKESNTILVLLPNILNPYYSEICKGAMDTGHKWGYKVMVCNTDSNINRELEYINLLKTNQADGLIFMSPQLSMDYLSEIGNSFPVVHCGAFKGGSKISHLAIDNFGAAYKAVKHLINLGHKRIGLISCENNFLSTAHREEGYKKVLEDNNISFDPGLIVKGDYGYKSGIRSAKQLLMMDKPPTAIFAISDEMAIGAIREIKGQGLKVPEDVAVVGFDDIGYASMCDPMLTTIAQPKYDVGCIAMDIIIKQLKGEITEPKDIYFEHELIIRQSTVK